MVNLPYALTDGIFNESVVVMTTKLREGADEDERRLYRRLASVRQPIELQHGNFFNKCQLFKNKYAFHLFNKAEMAYRTGIVFLVELSYLFEWQYSQFIFQ